MLVREKVNQAITILKEFDVDCWITFTRESQINGDPVLPFLISSDVTWHSAFIISSSGETHAIVGQYDRQAVQDTGAYNEVVGFVKGIREPFLSYLGTLNPQKIALNFSRGSEICDGITYGMYLILYDLLAELGFENRLISAENIVSALRERKSATEVGYIKQAIVLAQQIFDQVQTFIEPGKSEREIANFMKGKVCNQKLDFAWDEAHCPAVFSGPDTAGAHYTPTVRMIEKGHILNMDFGVKYNEYCSDLQRTFYILNEGESSAPSEVQEGFDTIVKAIDNARKAIKPGLEGREIDAIARKIICEDGYDEFPHGLGHQVGRFSHDGTALLGPPWEKYAQKPYKKLEEGMVFTLEPRLTIAERGIITIEEMVIITRDGCEYLSQPQKELLVIG